MEQKVIFEKENNFFFPSLNYQIEKDITATLKKVMLYITGTFIYENK